MKLTRDYKNTPLSTNDDVCKEDLYTMYCIERMKVDDICNTLPCSTAKLYRLIKKYGLKRICDPLPDDVLTSIDVSKLTRDYTQIPLLSEEVPTKSDIEYLYIVLNLTLPQISQYFRKGTSAKYAQKMITRYQIKQSNSNIKHKREQTSLQRYGEKHYLKTTEGKNKLKDSVHDKYGVDSVFQLEHVKQASHRPDVIEKARVNRKQSNLQKYGVENVMQAKSIQNKQRNVLLSKYGAVSFPQSKVSQETLEILNCAEAFQQLVIEYHHLHATGIGLLLNIDHTTVLRYAKMYGVHNYFNVSTSSFETTICETFKQLELKKDRKVLDGMEIDLYSKEKHIGIEFNGNYWHSDAQKSKYYHRDKSKLAESKGVFIFHIFEFEWNDTRTRTAILNRLNNLFGLNTTTIYARKCTIGLVDKTQAMQFLDANHVQGRTVSQIKLGLYYNGELVSLMEFTTNGMNKHFQWELCRFCSKAGTNVVGGASKLFKHFVTVYKPTSIVSYSDISKSNGGIYKTLGFTDIGDTNPQYWWTNGATTYNRYKTQRKNLIKLGWLQKDSTKSESDIMRENGFYKIYDCGKKIWSWKQIKNPE